MAFLTGIIDRSIRQITIIAVGTVMIVAKCTVEMLFTWVVIISVSESEVPVSSEGVIVTVLDWR